ncbi:uncharacterized protein LOC142226585 [Haematobia irritans]|uniref:uncharacterized protein LOC142225459 n=1 Tax=Haematobia irritans TaxID=7368 RepID=UPI003F4FE6FF
MAPRNPDLHKCLVCERYHSLRFCRRFLDLDVGARRREVRRLGYCFNCLARSHRTYECTSQSGCKICNDEHHSLLHIHPIPRVSLDDIERGRNHHEPGYHFAPQNRQEDLRDEINRIEARRQVREERMREIRLAGRQRIPRSLPVHILRIAIRTLKRLSEVLDHP